MNHLNDGCMDSNNKKTQEIQNQTENMTDKHRVIPTWQLLGERPKRAKLQQQTHSPKKGPGPGIADCSLSINDGPFLNLKRK